MTGRKRVLFVQPSLDPPGGGNGVAAWMLEALKGRHDVTALTWAPTDLARVDRFYGTSLNDSRIGLESVSPWLRRAPDLVPLPLALLKSSVLARAARKRAASFDVVVAANNEMDFGFPAIQYVHYPCYQRPRPRSDLRWYHLPPALGVYYWLADHIGRFSDRGIRGNLTLANSDWTGRKFTARYGTATRTLYPPVVEVPEGEPWEKRIDGFLCVGRISPEKELDRVIDIVARLRDRFPVLSLCLVGTPGPLRYTRHIRRRIRDAGSWASLREDLSRKDLSRLMGGYRYGLHGMSEEHFGMAPAELVAAGCIVFVPRGGGQVEIVGSDARLTFADADEAVERISTVLANEALQTELRASLAPRRAGFSTDHFMDEVRRIVEGFPAAG